MVAHMVGGIFLSFRGISLFGPMSLFWEALESKHGFMGGAEASP